MERAVAGVGDAFSIVYAGRRLHHGVCHNTIGVQ